MKKRAESGKIVTFYSFKGGVGRTMALANVAYLSAANGYRVLIMDWDLEAPGLAYYFRALLDAQDAKKLKECPGVLNMLWDWSYSIRSCKKSDDLKSMLGQYDSGDKFSDLIQTLNPDHFEEFDGTLDFIGAGSKTIPTPGEVPYEEALANFSWGNFFEREAGGAFLEKFRNWAKSRYDLIFIDSRTGLADVAGICTMQIPDAVALCFILNRQNIDGVAKVSSAVRIKRQEEVPVIAIPMRVTRSDTAEESDARARAFTELTRVGGFSNEMVADDFKKNSVIASESIPFYETLAPLAASNAQMDLLSINYLQLTTSILEKVFLNLPSQLAIPKYDEEFLEIAKRRLQPRYATVEYIAKLRSADPVRMATELNRLIEGALETEMDGGGLDDSYIAALTNAAIDVGEFNDDPYDSVNIQLQALDLLRIKAASNPEQWKPYLTAVLERNLDEFSYLHDDEEELVLLEEIDRLLADSKTNANRLKRIRRRRQTARIFLHQGNHEALMQTVGELTAQIKEAQKFELAADQSSELACAEIDIAIIRGDSARARKIPETAIAEYERGLYLSRSFDPNFIKAEANRLIAELNTKIATAPPDLVGALKAAEHAIAAVALGPSGFWIPYFAELTYAVLREENLEYALTFAELTMRPSDRLSARNVFTNYFGRQLKLSLNFFDAMTKLVDRILKIENLDNVRIKTVIELIALATDGVLKNILRRRNTIGSKQFSELSQSLESLIHFIDVANIDGAVEADLRRSFFALNSNSRQNPNTDRN